MKLVEKLKVVTANLNMDIIDGFVQKSGMAVIDYPVCDVSQEIALYVAMEAVGYSQDSCGRLAFLGVSHFQPYILTVTSNYFLF